MKFTTLPCKDWSWWMMKKGFDKPKPSGLPFLESRESRPTAPSKFSSGFERRRTSVEACREVTLVGACSCADPHYSSFRSSGRLRVNWSIAESYTCYDISFIFVCGRMVRKSTSSCLISFRLATSFHFAHDLFHLEIALFRVCDFVNIICWFPHTAENPSKRTTLKDKYKVQKKVQEHNRKARREAKRNPSRRMSNTINFPFLSNF